MKKGLILALALGVATVMFSGCSTSMPSRTSASAMQDYEARPPIETSLFPSDQAVLGDLAVKQILSSQLELPAKGKLAILKFPDAGGWGVRAFGGDYWRNEEYLKFQQGQVEMVSGALLKSEQIAEVIPMPSLMTPKSMSIPVLREAAVRMQADLLLVFRISSDTYSQYRLFAKDKVKAYSTCEFVLLDVRTGLVPFTRVISRERMAVKQPAELNVSETMRRAEQESASEALRAGAENLVGFVKSAPKRRE